MAPEFGFETTAEEVGAIYADEIKGKNILITGTSLNGLGAEVARVLAKYANLVIITGYNAGRLTLTEEYLKKEVPTANIRKLTLDLSTLATTRKAAEEVLSYKEPIHVLINNAGTAIGDYALTADGFEKQFGIDHLAAFLFTYTILPKLREAKTDTYNPRILFLSSGAHAFGPGIQWDNLKFDDGKNYERWAAYAQAKTANILTASEFARRLKGEGILAYSLHPGLIWTNMPAAVPSAAMQAAGMVDAEGKPSDANYKWKTIPQGSSTTLIAAFNPDIKDQTGSYLDDGKINNEGLTPFASSPENAARLWKLNEELIGQSFPL